MLSASPRLINESEVRIKLLAVVCVYICVFASVYVCVSVCEG